MKLTNKQKVTILKKALKRIEQGDSSCICRAIVDVDEMLIKEDESTTIPVYDVVLKFFPKLKKYKPSQCWDNLLWYKFGLIPPRRKILKALIREYQH